MARYNAMFMRVGLLAIVLMTAATAAAQPISPALAEKPLPEDWEEEWEKAISSSQLAGRLPLRAAS